MKAMFTAVCNRCEKEKKDCATVAVRGTNAYGDRDTRVMNVCSECRKTIRSLYRVHPKHRTASES